VARLAYALVAFLVSNLAVFFIATQLFGDLFVLLMLGLVSGFFIATPVLAERELKERGAARDPAPSMRQMLVPGSPLAQRAGRS
jgi:preprotein translocase subunit SecF